MIKFAFLLPLALISSGCETQVGDAPPPVGERIVDGVTHVEHTSRSVDTLAWHIDPSPVVTIGMADGPEEYLIGKLGGYLRLSDGRILIGDAISSTLRLYSPEGEFVRVVGGSGNGPGEYLVLRNILPHAADSVIVLDYEGTRITILDPSLEYQRSYRPRLLTADGEVSAHSSGVSGSFGDGSLLMYHYLNNCGRSKSHGMCEDSVALFRTDIEGRALTAYGRFVYGRTETYHVAGNLSTFWTEPHPQAFWRVASGRAVYGDAKRMRLLLLQEGGVSRIVTAPDDPRTYSKNELWPPTRSMDAAAPADPRAVASRRVMEEARANAAIPDSLPQFSDMVIDATGHVWVRPFMAAGRSVQEARWLVFNLEGHLKYGVRSPRGMIRSVMPWDRVHPQIGDDFVLTSVQDMDGVEYVVLYRLRKRPAA